MDEVHLVCFLVCSIVFLANPVWRYESYRPALFTQIIPESLVPKADAVSLNFLEWQIPVTCKMKS